MSLIEFLQPDEDINSRLPVDCLVMAAGLSSRMGQWKMMLPFGDQSDGLRTLLDHSLRNALQSCRRVVLVTGFRSEELMVRYADIPNIHLVHNSGFREGLSHSVLTALSHVETEQAFITLGDLPFLNSTIFQTIWQARGEQAAFPFYQSEEPTTPQKGHPVLLPASLIPGLLAENSSRPVRKRLEPYIQKLLLPFPEIIQDIDTPDMYREALAAEAEAH
ncbi:NTP transferase domain-containing protein [Parendozoicomonas haliclonae]|uniref:Molybdenum cofactor cytidylyltransferase n=1 Tax=Parendozoicomonas haliclonae TaxID=1960125 RepID=A0A1X7AQ08_9GAMM|nr:NTP transferase domain-containing protein [Parendozoicomonas haliclonae]SMA49480.1 Molybdenum cofactor cytidylyltransferase [Parendozoicomonas haliclonae]